MKTKVSLGEAVILAVAVLPLAPVLLAFIAVLLLITAFVYKFAWNHGITGLVHACGGEVHSISYATAYGTAWASLLVSGLLKRGSYSTKSKD